LVDLGGEILEGDCAVAGAEINPETETRAHLIPYELSLGSACCVT
jgi:hypothetical protein